MNAVNSLETRIKEYITNLSQAKKYIFLSAIIFGFLAHGFVFFNRLSVHDNSHCLFTLGATYEVNRWGLGILYKLQLLTTKTFSLPFFNGFLSIVFIAIAGMILVDIFDIQSRLVAVLVGALMVIYPMVTSVFSFMFTSWPYFMGLVFAFQAVRVLTKKISVKNILISSIWLALCLGLYQAFLGAVITMFLIKLFLNTIDKKNETIADYAKEGFSYLLELGLGLGIWAIIGKAFRTVKHIELETYKGWDEGYNFAKFPSKLISAIKNFLTFRMEGINALRYLRMLTMVVFILAVVMIVMLLLRAEISMAVKISSLVGLAFIPIGMVIVYLLSTSDEYQVSTLMIYAEVFVYILPLILLEKYDDFANNLLNRASQIISYILIVCISIVTVGYIYLDNAAYNKAAIFQEQAVVYMTALLADIKSLDGFSDDMEIVFVGFKNVEDQTINEVAGNEEMDGIQLEKYYNSLEEMIDYGVNIQFMRDHLGIGNANMTVEDPNLDTTVSSMAEVQAMPIYPNDGGIAIIDGMVVVKMGETVVED